MTNSRQWSSVFPRSTLGSGILFPPHARVERMITVEAMVAAATREGGAYIVPKDSDAGHFMYYLLVVANGSLTGMTGPAFAAAFNHAPTQWRFPEAVYDTAINLVRTHSRVGPLLDPASRTG